MVLWLPHLLLLHAASRPRQSTGHLYQLTQPRSTGKASKHASEFHQNKALRWPNASIVLCALSSHHLSSYHYSWPRCLLYAHRCTHHRTQGPRTDEMQGAKYEGHLLRGKILQCVHLACGRGAYTDQSVIAVGKQLHLFHNYSADWQSNQRLTETGTSPSLPRCVFSMALVQVSEWSHVTQRWMRSPDGTGDLVNICRRVRSNLLVLVLGTNEQWELILSICNYNWILRCASCEIGWNYNFQKESQSITIYHKPI